MKLEPVYLLTPEPKEAPVSRRGFIAAIAGCSLASFLAGFMVGDRDSGERAVEPSSATDDGELIEWALAVQTGTEAALIDAAGRFLMIAGHVADLRLQPGLERLAVLVREPDRMPSAERVDFARVLVMLGRMAPYAAGMRDHLSALRIVAGEVR